MPALLDAARAVREPGRDRRRARVGVRPLGGATPDLIGGPRCRRSPRRARIACAAMAMDPHLLEVARRRQGLHARRRGPGAARGRDPAAAPSARCSRSARIAVSRRCTWARPHATPAPCASRSIITAARRRTRPAGTTTIPRWSTRTAAAWTRCPFSAARFRQPGSKTSSSAVVGHSVPVARAWRTPLGFLFVDGGHAEDVAMADYLEWSPHIAPGGVLAIHDVFEDSADGGQAPFHVWQRAVADGFTPVSTTGSLRVLAPVTREIDERHLLGGRSLRRCRRRGRLAGSHRRLAADRRVQAAHVRATG